MNICASLWQITKVGRKMGTERYSHRDNDLLEKFANFYISMLALLDQGRIINFVGNRVKLWVFIEASGGH